MAMLYELQRWLDLLCQNALPVINQERTAAAQLLCQILDKLNSCLIMSGSTKPTRGPRRKPLHIRAEVLDNVCLVRPQYQLILYYMILGWWLWLLAVCCWLLLATAVAITATTGATAADVAAHAAAA